MSTHRPVRFVLFNDCCSGETTDARAGKVSVRRDERETKDESKMLSRLFDLLSRATGGPSLSKQGARSLVLWSYLSGSDPSLLAPYIYPLWTAGASYLPARWSPNVVTLTGFTLILALYAIVWRTCGMDCSAADGFDTFAGWLYPTVAVLMWGYQTADAMDGRQGKRVSMYVHPSTELFDHGVDGIVTSISGISSVALLGLGTEGHWGITHLCCLWAGFYITTHEHLVHGKITFPAGFSNPTEGLVMVVTTFLVMSVWPQCLETMVVESLSVVGSTPVSLRVKHCLVLSEAATVLLTLAKNIWKMVTQRDYLRPSMSVSTALSYLLPLVTVTAMAHGLSGPHRLSFVALASCTNLSILVLIICEMTKSKFPAVYLSLSFLPGAIAVWVLGDKVLLPVTVLGLLRLAGRWLNFQRELVHYCGMTGPMALQRWPEKHPNKQRLKDKIPWLVDPRQDIADGRDEKRDELLVKREHVELLD